MSIILVRFFTPVRKYNLLGIVREKCTNNTKTSVSGLRTSTLLYLVACDACNSILVMVTSKFRDSFNNDRASLVAAGNKQWHWSFTQTYCIISVHITLQTYTCTIFEKGIGQGILCLAHASGTFSTVLEPFALLHRF